MIKEHMFIKYKFNSSLTERLLFLQLAKVRPLSKVNKAWEPSPPQLKPLRPQHGNYRWNSVSLDETVRNWHCLGIWFSSFGLIYYSDGIVKISKGKPGEAGKCKIYLRVHFPYLIMGLHQVTIFLAQPLKGFLIIQIQSGEIRENDSCCSSWEVQFPRYWTISGSDNFLVKRLSGPKPPGHS